MVRLEPRTKRIVVECGCPGPDAVLVDMIAAAKPEPVEPWADRYARTHNSDGLPNARHPRPSRADPELLARIREAGERARRLVEPLPKVEPKITVVKPVPEPEPSPVVPIDRGRPRRVRRDQPRVIYPSYGDDDD